MTVSADTCPDAERIDEDASKPVLPRLNQPQLFECLYGGQFNSYFIFSNCVTLSKTVSLESKPFYICLQMELSCISVPPPPPPFVSKTKKQNNPYIPLC